MNRILKISIIFFIFLFSIGIVSATSNSSETNINSITKTSTDNHYVVSPSGKGVGKTDGNLFETIDYAEEHDTKTTVNLKSGTYKFTNQTINNTYHSNRRLGRNNLKYISFIGNNTVFDAENVRFFNIQKGTTAEFINILFTGGGATSGGSIYSEGNLILKNCSFINSTAQRYGGTLYLRGNNIIENTDFTETHTTDSRGSGGAIYITNATLKMNNVTVNHAVANKTAGLLMATNSNIELNYINVNNSYFMDVSGDGEIINANKCKLFLNNLILANNSKCGGLLNFNDCDSTLVNVKFHNFFISKGGSSYSLLYNDKNLKITNMTIKNVTYEYKVIKENNTNRLKIYPFILNNGLLNMSNLTYIYDNSVDMVLQNNKLAYLSGSFNTIVITRSGSLFLDNIFNSSISISNEGKVTITNMESSNINIDGVGFLKIDNMTNCVERIQVWYGEINNVNSYNSLSQWSINVVNVTNSCFNNVGTLFFVSNISNTKFINMPISLVFNESKMNNISFINNSVDCIFSKDNGNVSIDNSEFVNNKCNYIIYRDEKYNLPGVYMKINNTKFVNNSDYVCIKSSLDGDMIYIQNSSFINNTFSLKGYEFSIINLNNAYIKNNTYRGNNLSTNMRGSMINSLVYNNPLKTTLRVVTNDIFNTTINTGKASIYVDNKLYGNFGVFDGYIYITINNLSLGKHTIKVKYSDDTNSYMPTEKTYPIIVDKKILTKVSAKDKYAYAGSKVTFNASIFNYNNNPITTGRMVIKINGITLTSLTIKNTNKITYEYTVPNYTAKDYKLQYIYVGDDKYSRYEANKTLYIRNQSAFITANNVINYHNQTVQIKVRIVGKETGIPAAVGKVGFKINGQTAKINGQPIIQRVNNGWATFNYQIPKNLKADKYMILVTFSGGRNLLETRKNTSTLTVKDHSTNINIQTKIVKQSKNNNIKVQVFDSISGIKSGMASLFINELKVSETKIQNGQAVFNYFVPNILSGNYPMRVYAKGQYTDGSNAKSTLTVVK